MSPKTLSDLLSPEDFQELVFPGLNPFVEGLCADSREIKAGHLFLALPGLHHDGKEYAPDCLAKGARAVVFEGEAGHALVDQARLRGAQLVRVKDARRALSLLAGRWFGWPSKELFLLGVTGTDGKSSTVYFTQQILQAAGIKTGFFSTVAMQTGGKVEANGLRQSTPEATTLQELLLTMRNEGVTHAVIESTSHGLSSKTSRLRDIDFQGGAFTNLSHEHLEFHGSYEQYRSDKANLFRYLRPYSGSLPGLSQAGTFAILNRGDAEAAYFASQSSAQVYYYESEANPAAGKSLSLPEATLRASDIVGLSDSVKFQLHYKGGIHEVRLPLPGLFNVENILASLLLASKTLGIGVPDLLPSLAGIKGVKGRMLPVNQGQNFTALVDYAHTPGSYAKLLPQFRTACAGRLIAVFGSAGERDIEKRPMQGMLAARYCDELVLCNEDPRLEDEWSIIDAIKAGAVAERPSVPVHTIPDRREAIGFALKRARPGDTVVFLGKGHEQCIFYGEKKIPWDEESEVRVALADLGWKIS